MPTASVIEAVGLPGISHIIDSVEQGGTLSVFGEGITADPRVWLWQPSPNANWVLASRQAITELREMATNGLAMPALPDRPPEGGQIAEKLGGTGHPQVLMVLQAGSAHPAWDDNQVVPTLVWLEEAAHFSAPCRVNAPQLWFAAE